MRIARFVCHPILLCSLALILGCGSEPTLTSLSVTPATASLAVGQTVQLTATGRFIKSNQSTSVRDVTSTVSWSSANPAVATVSSAGLVTGVGGGTATVTATGTGEFSGVLASASITVLAGGSAGGTRDLVSITLIPSTGTVQTAGSTIQFQAIGNYSLAPLTQSLTSTATWQSSNAQVGTINSSGLATAVGPGTTTITASATSPSGSTVIATGNFTVTGNTTAARDLVSITIIPASQTVQNTSEQAQFLAIGNYSNAPLTADITNSVTWLSSDTRIATISASGLATATGGGTASITASTTAPVSGATITATATLVNPAIGSVTTPQLTVYKLGDVETTFGVITSTPGPISCGPICTGGFPLNSTVTLIASPAAGHTFVGFSSNCTPTGANTCTIPMMSNQTVAAEFQ